MKRETLVIIIIMLGMWRSYAQQQEISVEVNLGRSTTLPLDSGDISNFRKTQLPVDTLQLAQPIIEPKQQLEKQISSGIAEQEDLKSVKSAMIGFTAIDSGRLVRRDSTFVKTTLSDELEKKAVDQSGLGALEGGMSNAGPGGMEDVQQHQQTLDQRMASNDMKMQLATNAKDYVRQHIDRIQQMQSQMTDLKTKYTTVPDSKDLTKAIKHNSLRNTPFMRRFFIGGNIRIPSLDPFIFDFSPQLGWRVNKQLSIGASSTFRIQFGDERQKRFGYGLMTDYLFFRDFFAYMEIERLSITEYSLESNSKNWNESFFLGLGRRFQVVSWIQMHAMVCYNLLYDSNDNLYSSPFVFKTGFRMMK